MQDIFDKIIKAKFAIVMAPVVGVIFLILIVFVVIAAILGNKEIVSSSSFILPFDTNSFMITSEYGGRSDPINNQGDFHTGIDVVPSSSNIVAVASGTVVKSESSAINGEHIVIEHKVDGILYRSGYYHLKENSRIVHVGDKVSQGQQLAIMGATGRVTGPHLHFELQKYDEDKKKFVFTDPSIIVNRNTPSKNSGYKPPMLDRDNKDEFNTFPPTP